MRTFSLSIFEKLKLAVLAQSGLTNIVTADCKTLERLIFADTKLQVSETTLKRVFGFVYCKFNPSMYTINSLAKYCGYEGWEDFYDKQERQQLKDETVTADWEALKINADKITGFTLQALKNKSGIPYSLTIKRRFIDDHLNDFLNSGHTATVIAAPAGYGKTLALIHWVDEKLQQSDHDIVLFFSSSALMNVFLTGRDMNSWMLALLGYTNETDLQALTDIKLRGDSRFYLIVDGIDEHMYKNDQFQIILNQLADIFSLYQSHQWFKLVLSMRTPTWINNRHMIELGQDTFHTGFTGRTTFSTNVPLFSLSELTLLCNRINPAVQHHIEATAAEPFLNPLNLQFYYKQNQANFTLNNADSTSLYDVVSGFVLDKVYMGPCSAEKMFLINAIVDDMDLPAQRYAVSKIKMLNLLKQHPQAYNELLGLGLLRELNTSNNFKYEANVEFVCRHFLNFAVAQSLLYKNNKLFNADLIHTINQMLPNQQLPVLKWCVYYAVKNNQFENLELLSLTRLNVNQRLELVNFVGDLLKKEWVRLSRTHTLVQYFPHNCSDGLFNFMFSLEYLGADYLRTLQTLLKFRLTDHQKILVYTLLATRFITRFNFEKAGEYINNLKSFTRVDMEEFPLNPLNSISTIYTYYKHGVIDNSALKDITAFLFNPSAKGNAFENCNANDLIYLLALYALKIADNPAKNLRYVNTLLKYYKPLTNEVNLFNLFMLRSLNEEYLATGEFEKARACYGELQAAYIEHKDSFSPVMVSSFRCVKIINGFYDTDKTSTISNTNVHVLSSDHDNSTVKLYVLAFMLKYNHRLCADQHVYQQLSAEYNRTIREHGLQNTAVERKQFG